MAALGVPAIVAATGGVGDGDERPRPLAGPDAGAIAELVAKFLPDYLSASGPGDLSYLLARAPVVKPPGGGFELVAVAAVKQLGCGEGARRAVIATARVRDAASGAVYPLAYRLELVAAAAGTSRRSRGRSREPPPRCPRRQRSSPLVAALLAGARRARGRQRRRPKHRLAAAPLRGARSTAASIAIVGLVFLINRKFTDLAVFFVAAILVGWLVFSPDQVADAARAIGDRILP